ncbi:Hypothetical protein SRAE_X000075400 [Strongyloides ratti]|uniref:Uncharacterized protein n=1 Tax=Strongyloides ratti TaxID=34506 RepID=A0A090LUW2_STRRB|nr:Hypothetical protein SRAE_X000075400 [Strongyloides ratti]CEF71429.1 Hypothetical protein SRAE_X000075400 [Strongyloides ratti]
MKYCYIFGIFNIFIIIVLSISTVDNDELEKFRNTSNISFPDLDIDIDAGIEGINFFYTRVTHKRRLLCQGFNSTECLNNNSSNCGTVTVKCDQTGPFQNLFCVNIFTFPASNLTDKSKIEKREPLFKGCYRPMNSRDCPKEGGCHIQSDPMIPGNNLIFCCCRKHNCNKDDLQYINKPIPDHL